MATCRAGLTENQIARSFSTTIPIVHSKCTHLMQGHLAFFCKKISGKRKFSHKAQFSLKLTDLFVLTEQSNTGCQLRIVALTVLHPDVSHIPLDL